MDLKYQRVYDYAIIIYHYDRLAIFTSKSTVYLYSIQLFMVN